MIDKTYFINRIYLTLFLNRKTCIWEIIFTVVLFHFSHYIFFIVRSLSLKPRSILSQTNTSPIWKRKSSLTTLSPMNESIDLCLTPSSPTNSDRDTMSIQSISSGSNSSSLSNRIDIHQQQQPLITEQQTILQGQERLANIRINEIYRRRCYRAGLNIFNKYED